MSRMYAAPGRSGGGSVWASLRSVMRMRSAHKACAWWFEVFHVEQPRVQQLVCGEGSSSNAAGAPPVVSLPNELAAGKTRSLSTPHLCLGRFSRHTLAAGRVGGAKHGGRLTSRTRVGPATPTPGSTLPWLRVLPGRTFRLVHPGSHRKPTYLAPSLGYPITSPSRGTEEGLLRRDARKHDQLATPKGTPSRRTSG